MIAREQDPTLDLECTPEGDFEALQCNTEAGLITCVCVQPSDGTPIPNTEVVVADFADVPDCNAEG